jgi:hypothetical protein
MNARTLLILWGAAAAFSCNRAEPVSPAESAPGGLSVLFTLADTSGGPRTVFHAGEPIDMRCVVVNSSATDIPDYYPYPLFVFRVIQSDTMFASSTDGLAFPAIVVRGIFKGGDTVSGTWRAPNTSAKMPRISLPPGSFAARARINIRFENASVDTPADIPFTVIP